MAAKIKREATMEQKVCRHGITPPRCLNCHRPYNRGPEQSHEAPDLSNMTLEHLISAMIGCGMSSDPSDKAFSKACRDEIARRKPEKKA